MKSVSVVIPCFNESEGLPKLFSELKKIENLNYSLHWLFVNDGSTDDTGKKLNEATANWKNSSVVHHQQNRNLGAAIRTGIENAPSSDYIAFLDSDCTYAPSLLLDFFKELDAGADLVTASPYHPKGKVVGVPEWRLLLSKGLSFLYRLLTGYKIYTFTAMVRAMRFSLAKEIISEKNDFSAVAEMLFIACAKKAKIVEVPAVLSVRTTGYSKMKIGRTILAHLGILWRRGILGV